MLLNVYWKDERLTWNPSLYGNITQTMVNGEPNDKNFIWTPDLQLYEDGNIRLYDSFKRDWCILSHDGSI